MWDLCNGLSMRQMVDKLRLGVVRYGWMVQGVEGELAGSASAYTVGLTECRHPEIFMSGRPVEQMHAMLNELALMVTNGHRLAAGMQFELDRRIRLIRIASPSDVVLMARWLYGYRVQALQAVWADDAGKLPWEQDLPDDLTQPLFGPAVRGGH